MQLCLGFMTGEKPKKKKRKVIKDVDAKEFHTALEGTAEGAAEGAEAAAEATAAAGSSLSASLK